MRILITGNRGQLGQSLQRTFLAENATTFITALDKNQCDITDRKALKKIFKEYQPQWVLNTAAFTAVDLAQIQQQQAYDLNVDAVRYLAQECERNNSKLVHFSTDYVFSGQATAEKPLTPYVETDICDPLSIYGTTKLLGEHAIQEIFDNYLILRVSWLFSEYGKNFVKTIVRLLQEKDQLRMIHDQQGCPTFAGHVAQVVKKTIQHYPNIKGTFHYSDQPATTWYEFAHAIQACLLANAQQPYVKKEIIPIATMEYPTPAARPSYSVFNCTKIIRAIDLEPYNWNDGLNTVIKSLAQSGAQIV